MPFSQRRPVIKSDKHEVEWSQLAANLGTTTFVQTLALGVASADKDAQGEVEIGSRINAIYVEFNCAAQTTTNPKILHWTVQAGPEGSTLENPTTYYQGNRAQILKRGMEMLPSDVATVYKRIFVVRIPNKSKRMTQAGFISILFRATSTETINLCGFAIYKEYY